MNTALRLRIEHLLAGDFRPDHLTHLFLALRERAYGKQSVVEIGHFVAHQDQRNKGPATQNARDFFIFYRFRISYLERNFDLGDMPTNTVAALEANLRRFSDYDLKNRTGLNRGAAVKALKHLCNSIQKRENGRLFLAAMPEGKQKRVLDGVLNFITITPPFDGATLAIDFEKVLLQNDLLQQEETQSFRELHSVVALYGLSMMHGSKIDLGDGTAAELKAAVHPKRGLEIYAQSVAPSCTHVGKELQVSYPIFPTALPASEHCSEELLNEATWDFPVELRADKKLGRL